MFAASTIILIVLLYVGGLFLVALWTERKIARGLNPAGNRWVYSLSLAVYMSSWTYYGSVGLAARSGLAFLAVFLGTTLGALFWWAILRKLVRIKNARRITSIADFISARYDKSQGLAILVTVVALIGITPYISLQLKAILDSFAIIALPEGESPTWIAGNVDFIVVGLMVLFTIMFGVRRLDPTERHQGMVMAMAVECLVKLAAFLAAGVFVTFFLFDGMGEIFQRLIATPYRHLLSLGENSPTSYLQWFNLMLLSLFPFFLLPRQFHLAVVENSSEEHIRTAIWLLPLYMLLINIFVFPIAAGGLLLGFPAEAGDTFVLALPLASGKPWLATLVFIGGFSAATGMIIVSTMALSTMVTNHLLLPIIERIGPFFFLRRHLLQCRWAVVILILLLGYGFERQVGDSYKLVAMGVISFTAVLQFAPVFLGGLFWRGGNRTGALLGLGAGFVIWYYTSLLPGFVRGGWLSQTLLVNGPWGISLLRPEHLFGISGLDPVSHGVFWSLLFNIGLYLLGSFCANQSQTEQALAEEFVGVLTSPAAPLRHPLGENFIPLAGKCEEARQLLCRYLPEVKAEEVLGDCLRSAAIEGKARISITELADFHAEIEKRLAGSIGTASAHEAVIKGIELTEREARELAEIYAQILTNLRITPGELREKVDFYQEREALLASHTGELEKQVQELDWQIAEREKAEKERERHAALLEEAFQEIESVSYSISHDLRSPLRGIDGFTRILLKDFSHRLPPGMEEHLQKIRSNSQQMGQLIDDLLTYMRLVRKPINKQTVDLESLVGRVFEELRRAKPEMRAELVVGKLPPCHADPVQLHAVWTHLLDNAMKFSSGRDTPRIEVDSRQRNGQTVYWVRDNGIGFDMRYADKLFGVFQRLQRDNEFEGSGVGLATVQRIIQRHGGRVWAEAEVDKGATFYFTLEEG